MDANEEQQNDNSLPEGDTNLEIIRPLEIGYERLPDGVTALDFIHHQPIRSMKAHTFSTNEAPIHPIFGDLAFPSRNVLETKIGEHSELYKSIIDAIGGNPECEVHVERTYDNLIPWHLAEESEDASSCLEYEREGTIKNKGIVCRSSNVFSHVGSSFIKGIDKLRTKVNYLNFNSNSGNSSETSDDENII